MYICVWRPEINLRYHSLGLVQLFISFLGFPLAGTCKIEWAILDCGASSLLRLQACPIMPGFLQVGSVLWNNVFVH